MDRTGAVTSFERAGERLGFRDEMVLPSRIEAIERLVTALRDGDGFAVLTGEAGSGKSWICRKIRQLMPIRWRWAAIDLSPAVSERDVHRLILHAIGSDRIGGSGYSRAALANFLHDSAQDGHQWGLMVDEGQHATPEVLEELRIIGNRMGQTGAFAGLMIAGQNALARRLEDPSCSAFQGRIGARVHLRPLPLAEVGELVSRTDPARMWGPSEIEWLHRETAGNPRKIQERGARRQSRLMASPRDLDLETKVHPTPRADAASSAVASPATDLPPIVIQPTGPWKEPHATPKPPIHVEDEMIEVGWEPSPDAEKPEFPFDRPDHEGGGVVAPVGESSGKSRVDPRGEESSQEVVDDHYAALQAWSEWARNQGRSSVEAPANDDPSLDLAAVNPSSNTDREALDPDELPSSRLTGNPDLWADGQQEFAPYSQLFSRLRQASDEV